MREDIIAMLQTDPTHRARGSAWRVAIIQSNYIPWKGFFDLIGRCDEYIILDSVQYAKRHWHNRNRVMTRTGPQWLTIPVATALRYTQPIEQVEIAEPWAERHWGVVAANYRRAPHFAAYEAQVRTLYDQAGDERLLTRINEVFIRAVAEMLALNVLIVRDDRYRSEGEATDRLVSMCLEAGATDYLSGPTARAYLDESRFAARGIAVEWMQYGPYDTYPQQGTAFEHAVTVLDVIFNAGPEAARLCRIATPAVPASDTQGV